MRRIKKLFTGEKFYIFLFSLTILALSFSSLIYNIYITPPGTYFPLYHNHLLDYNLYLHYMRQVWEGNWLIITRYTPENFPARLSYFVYLFLGKFAGVSGFSLPVTYTLARLLGGLSFLFLIYKLIKNVYPSSKSHRILAFFLVLFGGGFWTITNTASGISINTMLNYWTEVDVVGRLTFIPHHLIAKVLMLTSFLLLDYSIKKKNSKLLLCSSAVGFLTGLASPFVALNQEIIVAITLVVTTIISLYHKEKVRLLLTYLPVYMFLSAVSLVYFRWLELSGYPWSIYLSWEKVGFFISWGEYALFSGPSLILVLFAISHFLKEKTFLHLLLVCWFIESWIGLFFLVPFFPVQNVRFLAGAYFIPLGVMAALGITNLATLLNKFLKIKKAILTTIIILLSALVFSGNIYANLKYQFAFFSPRFYNVYLQHDVLSDNCRDCSTGRGDR